MIHISLNILVLLLSAALLAGLVLGSSLKGIDVRHATEKHEPLYPSCHVCGGEMEPFQYRCYTCGASTLPT